MNVNVLQCNQGRECHCQRSYRSPVGGAVCHWLQAVSKTFISTRMCVCVCVCVCEWVCVCWRMNSQKVFLCFLIWSDLPNQIFLCQRWSSVMRMQRRNGVSVCVYQTLCVYVLAADSILGSEACIQSINPLDCIDSCQLSLLWLTVLYWWKGSADREMEDKTKRNREPLVKRGRGDS